MRERSIQLLLIFFSITSIFSLDKTISVAIFDGAKPVLYKDDDGSISGFFPAVLDDLLPEYTIDYITDITFQEANRLVLEGEIDILPAFIKTPEREENFYFNKEVILVSWGNLFIDKGDEITNFFDLSNKKIALMSGDQNGKNFTSLMKEFNIPFTPVYYDNFNEMVEAVLKEEAFGMVSFDSYQKFDNRLTSTTIAFSPVQSYYATAINGSISIMDLIDERMREQKKDPDSKYYENQKKWLMYRNVVTYPKWLQRLVELLILVLIITAIIFIFQRFKLKNITNKYSDFIDNTIDLIWIINRDGQVTYLNDHTLSFFNQKMNDILKKQSYLLFEEADQAQYLGITAKGLDGVSYEGEMLLDDNRTLLLSTTPVLRGKEKGGLFFYAKNNTDRKQMEQQLYQSQKNEIIGTLTSSIAHDFNNLLNPIIGISELLLLKDTTEEVRRKYITNILKASKKSADLVQKLLAFSKKQELKLTKCNLSDIFEEFEEILKQVVPKNIRISFKIDQINDKILVDKGQIEQVLLNLVINARDAIENSGEITIRTYAVEDINLEHLEEVETIPGKYSVIEIMDNGCGIPIEIKEKIFAPHFTTKGNKGTGLGLASCYGIVKQHNGYITVDSILDQGTTFKVYIPIINN